MSYRDFDEVLISAVRENPILYNKGSRNYKNVAAKAEIWAKISHNLGAPENECTSRWRALRDKYMRERKMRRSKPSGSASTSKPTWKFFEALNFLDDFVKSRESTGNYSNIDSVNTENILEESALQFNELVEELGSPTSANIVNIEPSTSTKNSSSKKVVEEELLGTMSALKDLMKRSENEETSTNAAFHRKVDALLDGLSNKEVAKKNIIRYLCKCQMMSLDNERIENEEDFDF